MDRNVLPPPRIAVVRPEIVISRETVASIPVSIPLVPETGAPPAGVEARVPEGDVAREPEGVAAVPSDGEGEVPRD